MEEMGLRIEARVSISTLAQVVGPHGLGLPRIAPPLARGLSRRRNHGVHQHKLRDRQPVASQRRAESAHGLGDKGECFGAPAAATMASAWSENVAPGQFGNETAVLLKPASRIRGCTNCQYPALPPAPGTRTKLRCCMIAILE